MKPQICFCWILLAGLCYGKAWGQTGIQFFEGTFDEMLDTAEAEEKGVFLFAYTEGCEDCQKLMDEAFADAELGKFFNSWFVNYKLDMEKGEGPTRARELRTRTYPTLMILTKYGKPIEKTSAVRSGGAFKKWAKGLEKNLCSVKMAEARFRRGERDRAFLYTYLLQLQAEHNYFDKVAPLAAYRKGMQGAKLLEDRNWDVFFEYDWDVLSPEFRYFMDHYGEFVVRYGETDCKRKLWWDYYSYCADTALAPDDPKCVQALNMLEASGIMGTDTLAQYVRISHREVLGDYAGMARETDVFIEKFGLGDQWTISRCALLIYKGTTDEAVLNAALGWVERLAQGKPRYFALEMNALLLHGLGRKEEALVVARRALEMGRAMGMKESALDFLFEEGK